MEFIKLRCIRKEKNTMEYDFAVSDGLAGFFSGKPFTIVYPDDLETVPDAILAVPFVSCVMPIAWVTGAVLEVPELDKAFWECVPELKKGYEAMYPETEFTGKLVPGNIVACPIPAANRAGTFFSGGLDSVQTLIRHLDEKPDLISIWGSDVADEKEEGWNLVRRPIQEYARKYGLREVTIRSMFRGFDLEWELDKVYHDQMQAYWWYGLKHGLALLGHAAPYAYLHGLSVIYIASSNCEEEGKVRCASDPSLDNLVRYANCHVVHDGFEFGRQDKVHNIVQYVRQTGVTLPLHVCWESQRGSNCCECEKCYRTMVGLMAEGEEPWSYGFEDGVETLGKMRQVLIGGGKIGNTVSLEWTNIRRTIQRNREELKTKPYWRYIKWIEKVDFFQEEALKLSPAYRLRVWLSQFRLLQAIYNLRKHF